MRFFGSSRLRVSLMVWAAALVLTAGAVLAGRARPDESLLLIAVRQNVRFSYNEVFLLDLEQCRTRQIPVFTLDESLAWSPDGERIAFSSTAGGGIEIHTARWDGTEIRRAVENFTTDTHISFGPDSRSLVYTAAMGAEYNLVRADLNSRTEQVLTSPGSVEMSPAWSPDGQYIAHVASTAGHFYLAQLDLQTGVSEPLADLVTRWIFTPQYSPDGRRIAFLSSNPSFDDYMLHVVTLGTDEAWERQITTMPADYVSELAWTPDGKSVSFLRMGGAPGLFIVDPLEDSERRVNCIPANTIAFAWKRG